MTSDAFRQYLEQLSAEYRRELPAKLAELEDLWNALVSGAAEPERLTDLQRDLHTLVGTAQTMGAPAVTQAARAVESFLAPSFAQGVVPEQSIQSRVRALLDALMQSAEQ
jgi:chemotaxis protein histidine kinase CheA